MAATSQSLSAPHHITVRINGERRKFEIGRDLQPSTTLSEFLRERLGFTSRAPRWVCSRGVMASAKNNPANPTRLWSVVAEVAGSSNETSFNHPLSSPTGKKGAVMVEIFSLHKMVDGKCFWFHLSLLILWQHKLEIVKAYLYANFLINACHHTNVTHPERGIIDLNEQGIVHRQSKFLRTTECRQVIRSTCSDHV